MGARLPSGIAMSPEEKRSRSQNEEVEDLPSPEENLNMTGGVGDEEDGEMQLNDADDSIEDVEGLSRQGSRQDDDVDVDMEKSSQNAAEAEQEEAEEDDVAQSQPRVMEANHKKKTGKAATDPPQRNSSNSQKKEPEETPEQKAEKVALIAEIYQNWGVSSFRDFIPPRTWLLGQTNIPDDAWSLETLRRFRNLSTLERSTDDEVKKGLQREHQQRGHQGKQGYKVGKTKKEKEANLRVDLEMLYEKHKGKKRAAGDETAGGGNAGKKARTADVEEGKDRESSGLTEDWSSENSGTPPVDRHKKDRGKGKARADTGDDRSCARLGDLIEGTAATAASSPGSRGTIEKDRHTRRSTRQTKRPVRFQEAARALTPGPSSAAPLPRIPTTTLVPQPTRSLTPFSLGLLRTGQELPATRAQLSVPQAQGPITTARPVAPPASNPTGNTNASTQARRLAILDARARLANAAVQRAESEWMLARARRAQIVARLLGSSYEEAYREVQEAGVRIDKRWANYLEIDVRRLAIMKGLDDGDDDDDEV